MSYFGDIWNYADMLPPIIITLNLVADFFFNNEKRANLNNFRTSMLAIASIGMWIKIFYFLRIFRSTGFFVNMLLRVIKRSAVFFLLYLLILCSFASSFYIMSPTDSGLIWWLDYTYLLGLGEFGMEWDEFTTPSVAQFFFLFATLLVMIVMLNILIAIVSTAYEEVIET